MAGGNWAGDVSAQHAAWAGGVGRGSVHRPPCAADAGVVGGCDVRPRTTALRRQTRAQAAWESGEGPSSAQLVAHGGGTSPRLGPRCQLRRAAPDAPLDAV